MNDYWTKALALAFTVRREIDVEKALAQIGEKPAYRHRHREKIVDFATSTSLRSDLVFTITHAGLMSHFYLHPHLLLGICLTNADSFVNRFHARNRIFYETAMNDVNEVIKSSPQGHIISMRPYYKESTLQNLISASIFSYNTIIIIQGFRRMMYDKATEYPKNFLEKVELNLKFWPCKSLPLFRAIPGAPAYTLKFGCVIAMAFLLDFCSSSAKTIHNAHQFKEMIVNYQEDNLLAGTSKDPREIEKNRTANLE